MYARLSCRVGLLLALPLALVCCSDSTGPDAPTSPACEGVFDPADETFVLRRVEIPVPGDDPVLVDFLARDLTVDREQEIVRLEVALRNASQRPLYPPATVWLHDFHPDTVEVLNASHTPATWPELVPHGWLFDYSWSLGPDAILGARGQSDWIQWAFHDPSVAAFSFAADVSLELEPVAGVLAGHAFDDPNQDGIEQEGEGGWPYGVVHLRAPSGVERIGRMDAGGGFRFWVDQPGLYQLRLESIVDCIVCFTTPNPLEVLLPEAEDGAPESFWGARFGAICGPCVD